MTEVSTRSKVSSKEAQRAKLKRESSRTQKTIKQNSSGYIKSKKPSEDKIVIENTL